jgi:hypothetical protein
LTRIVSGGDSQPIAAELDPQPRLARGQRPFQAMRVGALALLLALDALDQLLLSLFATPYRSVSQRPVKSQGRRRCLLTTLSPTPPPRATGMSRSYKEGCEFSSRLHRLLSRILPRTLSV